MVIMQGKAVRRRWQRGGAFVLLLVSLALHAEEAAADRGGRRRVAAPRSEGRGAFAFHYAPTLSAEALAWYSRFDILVTHDPIPRDQVEQLHAAGTKVLFYEWSVAFYESRATDWQRSLLASGADLLNRTPLTGSAGSETAGAWYFDPASPQHELGRAEDIVRRMQESGYDGVFFDTTTVESVHPAARTVYELRHPFTPYDLAFSRFLSRLRERLPKAILFTNQGYRNAPYYLPYVDWDLTESLITHPGEGTYDIRAWDDAANPWSSINFVMQRMIEPVAKQYPHVRFGHLNYANRSSAEMTSVVVATAQIFGGEGYVAAPTVREEIDSIYLRRPGRAISDRIEHGSGKAAWRFFENGLVVVSAATHEITIENLARGPLRNHLTGEVFCGDVITIAPAPGEPRASFFDAVPDCPR